MKWPWWQLVEGPLSITGRRLDGPSPPMCSNVVNGEAYARTGFLPRSWSGPRRRWQSQTWEAGPRSSLARTPRSALPPAPASGSPRSTVLIVDRQFVTRAPEPGEVMPTDWIERAMVDLADGARPAQTS